MRATYPDRLIFLTRSS